jgi:hypothetical protein
VYKASADHFDEMSRPVLCIGPSAERTSRSFLTYTACDDWSKLTNKWHKTHRLEIGNDHAGSHMRRSLVKLANMHTCLSRRFWRAWKAILDVVQEDGWLIA